MFFSILSLTFLVFVKPFHTVKYRLEYIFELYNESTTYLISLLVYAFDDLISDTHKKYRIGWAIIFFVALNIWVNIGAIAFKTVLFCIKTVKKALKDWKFKNVLTSMAGAKLTMLKVKKGIIDFTRGKYDSDNFEKPNNAMTKSPN